MSRTVLLSAILAGGVAVPIQGAPIPLLEFTHGVLAVESAEPLPATAPFRFVANEQGQFPPYFSWEEEYGPSDTGMTFVAPQEVAAGANSAIRSPTANYFFETGPANFSDPLMLNSGTIFVDDVTLYTVTLVERIIDRLIITRTQGDFYFLEAAQRIRFWGEPVPEPSGLALALLACVIKSGVRV
jgi:hypothetical protein